MSGFLTTETISPSSGFVGRQRLESFSLFPQALGIICPQRYPSKRKIKSRRNLRGSYFVVSHPSQSQLSFGALIHGTLQFFQVQKSQAQVIPQYGSMCWFPSSPSCLHPREEQCSEGEAVGV